MTNSTYFIDIHVHPGLRPWGSSTDPKKRIDMWQESTTESVKLGRVWRYLFRELFSPSQANLDKCLKGKARVLFASFYPIEKPMFDMHPVFKFLLSDKTLIKIGSRLSGIGIEVLSDTFYQVKRNEPVNYFEELEEIYGFLREEELRYANRDKKIKIARNYKEIKQTLDDPDQQETIVIVPAIEGAHSLSYHKQYSSCKENADVLTSANKKVCKEYCNLFEDNIRRIKNWGPGADGSHTPLFITFSHHFCNLLCGQAKSLSGITSFALNQKFGMDYGFSELGRTILHSLLDRENGRRILIDIKHMSATARSEFYNIRKSYLDKGDPFPIVCSHAAVNGRTRLAGWKTMRDTKKSLREEYFNTWSINLFDEDIRNIFESGGLIGLILNEDRMPGGIPKKTLTDLKRKVKSKRISPRAKVRYRRQMRDEYIRLLMANTFHILRVCNDPTAWDMIGVGSDLDGLINTFDSYTNIGDYRKMASDIRRFLYDPKDIPEVGLSKQEIKRLMFSLTPEEIVTKLTHGSVELFMSRYFNDEYRLPMQVMDTVAGAVSPAD